MATSLATPSSSTEEERVSVESTGRSGQRDAFGFIWKDGADSNNYSVELSLSVIKDREKKWLEILSDWPSWAAKKPGKIKQLCRKGIPSSLRQHVWMHLCGALSAKTAEPTLFKELLAMPGKEFDMKCIELDIRRVFPNHEYLMSPQGQDDLKSVLKAFTIHRKDLGYTSGMSFLGATFLMNMPAEDAFWCLVKVIEHYLPEVFVTEMIGYQVDSDVLDELVAQHLPETNRFFKNAHCQVSLFAVDWIVLVYVRNLPWSCVLRIWDMYLCEGNKVKFRIALALLKLCLGKKKQREMCGDFFEVSQKLRHLTLQETHEDILIPESLKFNLKDDAIHQMYKKHKHRITQERKVNKAMRRSTFCGTTNGGSTRPTV